MKPNATFSGSVECLSEVRIDGGVAVRIVLPARISASIIYLGADVARFAGIEQAGTAGVIESIVGNVLVVRIGITESPDKDPTRGRAGR